MFTIALNFVKKMLAVTNIYNDAYFMRQALIEAEKAFDDDEVPIGAIVVYEQTIIGKGYNQVIRLNDATAHAEMIAITAASSYIGGRVLKGCTIYVTLEPCTMCIGAIQLARIDKLIYAAHEPKTGYSNFVHQQQHKKLKVQGGVEANASKVLLQNFFKQKRTK